MAQDVFLALFENDARMLRAWDPARGASLKTFIALVARHQACSILRSRRQKAWSNEGADDTELEDIPSSRRSDPEARVASRQLCAQLMAELERELSPRGLELFQALLIEDKPIEIICRETGMKADAVYAWRSRLRKLVQRLSRELTPRSY